MKTPEAELHAAFLEAGGLAVPVEKMNREMMHRLREILRMGFNAEDVRAVVAGIKWHLRNGSSGYGVASLMFHVALNPMTFQGRAVAARKKAEARARKAAALASRPPPAAAAPEGPNVSLDAVKALKRSLSGGGGR